MSYDIQVFTKETKLKEQQYINDDFFENECNLVPFTKQQIQNLKKRLELYNYEPEEKNEFGLSFSHPEFGNAMLTTSGLYFSTSHDPDCIFEVGLTASEFTDTGEFHKYDPQIGAWEEVE